MKKKDLILIAGLILAACLGFMGQKMIGRREAGRIRITVEGESFGEYNLDKDMEIWIGNTNKCRIEDGKASMIWAECPDQICVKHAPIGGDLPGVITCLPNRVVIETISGENAEPQEDSKELDIVVG